MSITSRAKQYGNVFGSWKIRQLLGEGSQGKTGVFRIIKECEELEELEESALKVVNVIQEDGYPEELSAEMRADYEQRRKLLRQKAACEVKLMKRMAWSPYVVPYQAWEFSDWDDEGQFGCDLLIQMRILNTLDQVYRRAVKFEEDATLKVGRDICQALILCDEEQIVHRDIKPSNIFIDPQGKGCYMLGDFGISRIIDRNNKFMSSILFTPAYAAPEQIPIGGTAICDKRADLYSLGLTLYVLANRGRLPFASSTRPTEEEIALRLKGTPFPDPCHAGPGLSAVIRRACAFRAEDRYQSAAELLTALEELTSAPGSPDVFQTRKARAADAVPPEPHGEQEQPPRTAENRQYADGADQWELPLLQNRAEEGDADAQLFLGMRCHLGVGVKKDLRAAVQWYKKAAAQGSDEAKMQLECLYDPDTDQDTGQLRIPLPYNICFTAPDKGGKSLEYIVIYTWEINSLGRKYVIFTQESASSLKRKTRIYASSVRYGENTMALQAVETQAELDELRANAAKLFDAINDRHPLERFVNYRSEPPASEVQNELPWRSLLLIL